MTGNRGILEWHIEAPERKTRHGVPTQLEGEELPGGEGAAWTNSQEGASITGMERAGRVAV